MRPRTTKVNKKRDKLGDRKRSWEIDKGDKGDKTSGRRTYILTQVHIRGERQWQTRGDQGRQGLGQADTPSNTGTHVGRQYGRPAGQEGRRRETIQENADKGARILAGGHAIHHRHTCGKETRPGGRRARH